MKNAYPATAVTVMRDLIEQSTVTEKLHTSLKKAGKLRTT